MNFDELAAQRRLLQDFCSRHQASLLAFQRKDGKGFKLTTDEPEHHRVHLTTTATCIESLLSCPARYAPAKHDPERAAKEFAQTAIDRPPDDWMSERSANIYCRCRGLPLTIKCLNNYDDRLNDHIRRILRQLQYDFERFAIGEADVPNGQSEADVEKAKKNWYPPNAFHTFWTLEILTLIRRKFQEHYARLDGELGLKRFIQGMILWSSRTLGYQVALHTADSSILDSDQLGWSLATLLKFGGTFPADLGEQDLLREALKQLFKTQLSIGTWRHYRSLFHYEAAGNAYCYVYETFAVLLGIAIDGLPTRQVFRDTLRQYVQNLTRLWQHAKSTRLPLEANEGDEPSLIGWCSGHRLNQTMAESWATASVFHLAKRCEDS
jgi:hypothetical protein